MNWAKKQANAKRVSSNRVMAVGPAQAVTLVVVAEILAVEQVVTLVVAEILAVGAVVISKGEDRRGRGTPRPFLFCSPGAFIVRQQRELLITRCKVASTSMGIFVLTC